MAKLLQHSVTNHKKTNNVFVGNTEDKLSTVPALISTIQTGHRAKSAAALQKITHRDGIIDEVNNFIRQTQASGSLHLSSVVDFIGESDFHPIYSLSIIVAPWLKVDPESNRYYFTEELEELVDRKIYTKVWLPGFGEYPIPSIHYNLIKYQIDAAWVQTQRQYAPQIDNRATLNYIEPGGGSFLGSTMTNILERVQAGFGVTGHDCQEVREYLIPERFRNHSNHSEKFLTVGTPLYLAATDEYSDGNQFLTNSGKVREEYYHKHWLTDVDSRSSNFIETLDYNGSAIESDYVHCHDLFREDEVRTHGSKEHATEAMQQLLLKACDKAYFKRTDYEYQIVAEEVTAIHNQRRREKQQKELKEALEKQVEENELDALMETGQKGISVEEMLHNIDPFDAVISL
eukprot:GHVH01012565.1.p1 GENE.GHVH01012565.1~~GHVH01012565.1.p1  ORF type:complete len:402 (+),score=66.56 GHVH01012565.1:296-1501(+)